jgi:acyl carrier protein
METGNMMRIEELKAIIEMAMDQEVPNLQPDMDLYTDIGMDSIGAVAMIVEIQRQLNIRVPEDDVPELRTPTLLIEYLDRALQSQYALEVSR